VSAFATHIVSPAEFDLATAQTSGSERRAAITPVLGIELDIWGGLFEFEPEARTGIRHHGEQETIAYVLSGDCETHCGARSGFAARTKAGDFISCSPLYRSIEFGSAQMSCHAQRGDANRRFNNIWP
jgi:uncharacterized RmlC-like cupin family protein